MSYFFHLYLRSQNPNGETDADLLRNTTVNTVIVDFTATNDLKNDRKLVCKSILNLAFKQ